MYDKMNWHDGKKTCEADGTKMVVPKSEEENSFIASLKPGQDCCSYDLYHANFCVIWQSDFEQTNRLFGLVSMILTRKDYLLILREIQLNSICGMPANQMIHPEKMLLILSMQIVDGPMVMGPCKRDSGMIKTSVTDFMSHVFSTHQKVSLSNFAEASDF